MVVFFGAPPNKDPGDGLHEAKPATCIKAIGRSAYEDPVEEADALRRPSYLDLVTLIYSYPKYTSISS